MGKILTQHTFMSSVTASGASASYLTDYRFDTATERTIQGMLTSGASIALYTHVNLTSENTRVLVSTFSSSSFVTIIEGPVAKIEVVKTSGGGTAWVDGLV